MEIKTIKNLSNRWVDLISIKNQIAVRRIGTVQQISNILQFYQQIEYPHRPKILKHWVHEKKPYIIEEFISGKHANYSRDETSKILLNALLKLYKNHVSKNNLKTFIEEKYTQKLASLAPFDEKTLAILGKFFRFFSEGISDTEDEIEIHQVHWDLKSDNIILHKNQAILIDRERQKISHCLEDIQKFIEKSFQYEPDKVDNFLNLFFKEKSIIRKDFLYLESFFFFLNKILDLSKKRISNENFIEIMEKKINTMQQSKLYSLKLHNKSINIGTYSDLSNIFKNKKQVPESEPIDIISSSSNINNQKQRIAINKYLMLEKRDFIIVHGAACILKNGKRIIITWPSWSGKTHTLSMFQHANLLKEIYDEDLININTEGNAFALADQNFKGYKNESYLYEDNKNNNLWKIDAIIQIKPLWKNVNWEKKINMKNLIHESLVGDQEIQQHYKNFEITGDIQIFTLKQYYTINDFYSLLSKLWINQ